MCELDDFDEFLQRGERISRRRFGQMAMVAGLAAALPRLAHAGETVGSNIDIETPDGIADGFFVHPAEGSYPGVLMWPDIFGLRPAFTQMATRLAESGYAVLVVNPFYRTQRAPTAPDHADFSDPATREHLMHLRGTLSAETTRVDAKAFAAFLDQQPGVDAQRKLGTMGYCMSGSMAMQTAATLPDRVGAGASFHGGGLVTEQPDSPHLLAARMKARFLIAIAESDDAKSPKAKDTLRDAFAQASLPAEIEVYAGTHHGWCPTDSRVYAHDQAEKAWGRMLALFGKAL